MTENNGVEPKKPKVQLSLSRDDESGLSIPHWLLEDPERWVDGMTFKLRRRLANSWELVLESSPATIVDPGAPGGRFNRNAPEGGWDQEVVG